MQGFFVPQVGSDGFKTNFLDMIPREAKMFIKPVNPT
jgi:hypothetical protein